MITAQALRAAVGCSAAAADLYDQPLLDACALFNINTPARLAAFLAQIGHESASFRLVREVWGPTPAQQRYEGRKDLGNVHQGDGIRYLGRGLMQITGRANYAAARDRLRKRLSTEMVPDFEAHPMELEAPQWACLAAAEYWAAHRCNEAADAGDFEAITRRINGGLNGFEDRKQRWERAKQALLVTDASAPAAGSGSAWGGTATAAAPPEADAPQPAMPAGEAPDWVPPAPKEQSMPIPAVVTALLPSLIEAAPNLIRIFGSGGAVSERNAKAAEAVAGIARSVTGQSTTEGAVQVIQSDPDVAAKYREQVHQSMGELLGHLQQAVDIDDKSRALAMDRNLALGQATGGKWLYFLAGSAAFILLATMAIATAVLFAKDGGFTGETKALILGQIIIGGFAAVREWMFGSNIANRISQRDNKGPQQ